MRYETFGYILMGVFVVIGIIAMILILYSEKKAKIGIQLGRISLGFIIIILAKITVFDSHVDYSLDREKEEWARYKTPQIDSFMYLDDLDNKDMQYKSLSKDSIKHLSKTITYDLGFIDQIEDVFANDEEDLILEMTFVKSNLFRKEKRINNLHRSVGPEKLIIKSLTVQQTDSVLKVWGYNDDLYTVSRWK